jgi:hypothetical protein
MMDEKYLHNIKTIIENKLQTCYDKVIVRL